MTTTPESPERRFGCLHVLLVALVVAAVSAGVTYAVLRAKLFPREFEPVTLSPVEEQALQVKLDRLEGASPDGPEPAAPPERGTDGAPLPVPYSEEGLDRTVRLNEREVNALLARNTDLARKVAIDLSDELISAHVLLPMDPELPVVGGKTLRVRAGLKFAFENGRPVLALRGVTVMGVPLPNAWLGGLKNVDLVREFGGGPGFWNSFAEGIAAARVEEGQLTILLNE